jgi:PAS domain S-box-containing protein
MSDATWSAVELRQLRGRARRRLARMEPVDLERLSREALLELAKELQLSQVELELQQDGMQRLQRRLLASEERYRQLYEDTPVGHLSLNATGCVCELNTMAARQLGWARATVLGRPFVSLLSEVQQSVWEYGRRAAVEAGKAEPFQLDIQRPRAAPLRVEVVVMVAAPGSRRGAQLRLALIDLSEQRALEQRAGESERRIQLILNAAPLLIAYFDRELRYRFVNAAYETWFGLRPAQIQGRPVRGVLGEPAYQAIRSQLEGAVRGERQEFESEVPYALGGTRWISAIYVPDRCEEGEVVGVYAFVQDITSLKRANELLRDSAARQALAEERARRKLADDLHDDVSQLLAFALAHQRALRGARGAAREAALDELGRVLSSAREHVNSLSFQLSPPVLYDLGLRAAAEWLVEEFARLHRFRARIEPGVELRDLDEAVRVMLFRGLRELLVNALRHSGSEEARVVIRDCGDAAQVEVHDSGVGFNPSPRPVGYGLLSLRAAIEHLGGSLVVCSEPGRGTSVTVRIPRKVDSAGRLDRDHSTGGR